MWAEMVAVAEELTHIGMSRVEDVERRTMPQAVAPGVLLLRGHRCRQQRLRRPVQVLQGGTVRKEHDGGDGANARPRCDIANESTGPVAEGAAGG